MKNDVSFGLNIFIGIDRCRLQKGSNRTKIANRQLQPSAMGRQLTSFNVAQRWGKSFKGAMKRLDRNK